MKRLLVLGICLLCFATFSGYSEDMMFLPETVDTVMANHDTMFTDPGGSKFWIHFLCAVTPLDIIFYSTASGVGVTNTVITDTLRFSSNASDGYGPYPYSAAGRSVDSVRVYLPDPTNQAISIWPDRSK